MGMLAIYVDQVMRPSFLPNLGEPTRRPAQPVAEAKRREVLNCLKAAGKPVTATWVMDYTGYTKQSVMHILYRLEIDGLVRRVDVPGVVRSPGVSCVLWEVARG